MALETKWVIAQLDTAPSLDGLTDVVKNVHYRYQGQDGKFFAEAVGIMECATPSETDFTAYDDLTYEQICAWLEDGLNVEAMVTYLASQIDYQKNPPIINLPLPWDK